MSLLSEVYEGCLGKWILQTLVPVTSKKLANIGKDKYTYIYTYIQIEEVRLLKTIKNCTL